MLSREANVWKVENEPLKILSMNSLMKALEQFEVVEANLVKAERLWDEN